MTQSADVSAWLSRVAHRQHFAASHYAFLIIYVRTLWPYYVKCVRVSMTKSGFCTHRRQCVARCSGPRRRTLDAIKCAVAKAPIFTISGSRSSGWADGGWAVECGVIIWTWPDSGGRIEEVRNVLTCAAMAPENDL